MKERLASRMVRLLTVLCLCGPLLAPAGAAVAAPEAPAGPVLSPMGESTLGDLVWHDSNVDGLQNDVAGINGVVVNLYLSDGDANFEPGAGDTFTTTLTTAVNVDPPFNSGWYDFAVDGLQQYWVEIPITNSDPGGALENYVYTGNLAGQPYNGPEPRHVTLILVIEDYDYADFGYALAGIEIVKVADGTPDGDTKFIQASDTVTYTYRYTNTGETHLDSVIITDDLGTATPVDDVQICTHAGLLAPAASGQCEWSDSVDSNRTNIATIVGNPTDSLGTDLPGNDATDSDDAVVVIEAPCLEVIKDLDDPIGGVTVVSETITYTIWITNCGTTTVTHVPLYDYFCPACMEFTSWSIPPTNVDHLLGTVYWEDVLSPTVGGPDILLPTEGFSVTVDFHAVISDTMYWKEKWHDYALSGMPDFDQKQDAWGADPGSGWRWTYCGPVAAANSIWWFDSKFEDPNSPPPPTVNDSYNLVTPYGAWDDHDPANVQPLVNSLAWYVDTDGIRTGSPISGTNVHDLAAGVAQYITDTVGPGQYTVIDVPAPEFAFIEDEVRRSEDVILLLGFWQDLDPPNGLYERVGGHYVTVAGVDSQNFRLALSDPYRNNAAGANPPHWMGGPGRVRPNPHDHPPFPLQPPGEDTVHNDSWFTSQDVYVAEVSPTPGGPWGLPDYIMELTCDEINNFVGQNVGDHPNTLDHCVLGVPVFTEIEYVVAVSPTSEETIPCQPVNNVVVISGAEDEHGFEIPEVQDNETITITQASIAIDKVPDNQQVVSGGTANWTIYVTNTGDVALDNVTVTDALAPNCAASLGTLASLASTSYACSLSGVTADFTNVADVTGDPPAGPPVTDSDDADVDVIGPSIAIDKVPDLQQVVNGGTANWTIYVTNTGDVALTSVVVTDVLAPNCDNTIGALAVGASTSYACSLSPVTADFTNVADVTGDPPVGPPVTDSDDADVDVINPDIAIDKVPDLQQVVSGGTANWTIYVTNTGDVALTSVVVTDVLAPNCNNTIGALAVGASTSYACSLSPVTADFTNVADVTGDPPVGPPVTDSDDADVDVINPDIAIDKVPDYQQVVSGGTANWTIYVTNTGDVALDNVTVTDVLAPDCDNAVGTLASLASTSYACSLSGVTADFTNVADVTGDPPVGPPVTDSDDADVDVIGPDIAIDKVPDLQQVVNGGTANWTIYVTNTGDVALTNVVVTDVLAPNCDNTIGALAVGASTSYACSLSPVTADFTNVADVTGDPPVGPPVTDSDDADVDVINPDIAIDKVPDNQQVVSGGTANWTIYVTNTGDVALTNVVVTDVLAPNCNNTIGALAAGVSTSYACSLSPVTADFTNVADVTGDPPVGPPVTDSDDADVDVINPDIAIDKVPDYQQVVSGGTANWTIYVTNTGDVALDNVTVTDVLAPDCDKQHNWHVGVFGEHELCLLAKRSDGGLHQRGGCDG